MQLIVTPLKKITIFALSCISMSSFSYAQNLHTTIPSARMHPLGYMDFKIEALDPYIQTSLGMQFHDSFYAQIKQTAQTSSLRGQADKLYPGIDFKFKLFNESYFVPQTVIGLNSAIGQSSLASEYITMSKRYKNLDFTGGIAWGKLGSAAHMSNPLKSLSSHFGNKRPLNDENDNQPNNWFTGQDIGFFAGVEYQTPWEKLHINLDWSADRYEIEQNLISGFNTPNPWSIGTTIQISDPLSFHGAIVGGEKLMGRITYAPNVAKIKTVPQSLSVAKYIQKQHTNDFKQRYMGLTGKRHLIPKRQIESLTSTPSELWHDLEIENSPPESYLKTHNIFKPLEMRIKLEQKFDISEESNGALFRNATILNTKAETVMGLIAGLGLRVNIGDDLPKPKSNTNNTSKTVRSDIVLFAENRFAIDRLFLAKNYSYNDVHTQIAVGHLEEMYSGYGGQILYRPYNKTYAFGAEAWSTVKRDPYSDFNIKTISNTNSWTGHINAYYELPNTNTTLHSKVGRYLGEDYGGTIAISQNFKNGAEVTGYLTHTNKSHLDLFSGESNVSGGLNLSVPLSYKRMPKYMDKICCDLDLNIEPLTRDTGQILNTPLPLYKTTEPLSYRHLIQNWGQVKQ